MKKYEILEHRTDLRIRAFGKTKEELFLNMLKGMSSVLSLGKRKEKAGRQMVKVESPSRETLLVDFLNQVLYLDQTNRAVYDNPIFQKFTDNEIEAELQGRKIDRFREDIKAATYHDLEMKKNKYWQVTVLFDI